LHSFSKHRENSGRQSSPTIKQSALFFSCQYSSAVVNVRAALEPAIFGVAMDGSSVLAKKVQVETSETVEVAYVDQDYTGESAADAAEEHGINFK
jgi:hypothetical protein